MLMRGESWFMSKRVLFNACCVKGGLEVRRDGRPQMCTREMSEDSYFKLTAPTGQHN